jgi:hypothetical protein
MADPIMEAQQPADQAGVEIVGRIARHRLENFREQTICVTIDKNLQELFHETLKDIYFAEKKLLSVRPKMAKAAQSQDLKAAFEKHETETQEHVDRLEKVFEEIDETPRDKTCDAIVDIIEESQEVMKESSHEALVAQVRSRTSARDTPPARAPGHRRSEKAGSERTDCANRQRIETFGTLKRIERNISRWHAVRGAAGTRGLPMRWLPKLACRTTREFPLQSCTTLSAVSCPCR